MLKMSINWKNKDGWIKGWFIFFIISQIIWVMKLQLKNEYEWYHFIISVIGNIGLALLMCYWIITRKKD